MSIPHTKLYHFTNSARLPWIVGAKELRPDCNQIGGFPSPDFLRATRSQGDRTASGMQGYREPVTALVRLTLFAEDFEPWPAITARSPQWTIEHVRRLEAAARVRGQTNFECWRARAEPLPLSRTIRAEATTYTNSRQAIEVSRLQYPGNPAVRSIILNGKIHCSHQHAQEGYPTG